MNRTPLRTLAFVPLAMLGLGLGAPEALAVDRHYSGQNCRSDDFTRYNFHSNGIAIGSGSGSMDVHCPVGGHQNSSVNWESATVWVYDTSSFSNISCRLNTVSFITGTIYAGASVTSSGAGGFQAIQISGLDLPNDGFQIAQAIQSEISCTLPGYGTHITGYRVSNVLL